MKILAHRGKWEKEDNQNSFSALTTALENGFGIETDIRDYMGKLVISHNVPETEKLTLEELLCHISSAGLEEIIALNVKADGIQDKLLKILNKYHINNYFMFDMSVPEMVVYSHLKIPFFSRFSDIESECVLYNEACGIWVDSFYQSGVSIERILEFMEDGKKVCLVSPELHGRNPKVLWQELRHKNLHYKDSFLLCTDFPAKAREVFDI